MQTSISLVKPCRVYYSLANETTTRTVRKVAKESVIKVDNPCSNNESLSTDQEMASGKGSGIQTPKSDPGRQFWIQTPESLGSRIRKGLRMESGIHNPERDPGRKFKTLDQSEVIRQKMAWNWTSRFRSFFALLLDSVTRYVTRQTVLYVVRRPPPGGSTALPTPYICICAASNLVRQQLCASGDSMIWFCCNHFVRSVSLGTSWCSETWYFLQRYLLGVYLMQLSGNFLVGHKVYEVSVWRGEISYHDAWQKVSFLSAKCSVAIMVR